MKFSIIVCRVSGDKYQRSSFAWSLSVCGCFARNPHQCKLLRAEPVDLYRRAGGIDQGGRRSGPAVAVIESGRTAVCNAFSVHKCRRVEADDPRPCADCVTSYRRSCCCCDVRGQWCKQSSQDNRNGVTWLMTPKRCRLLADDDCRPVATGSTNITLSRLNRLSLRRRLTT